MNRFFKGVVKLANTNIHGARVLALRNCTTEPPAAPPVKDVPGLSQKVVNVPSAKVGFPEASKEGVYKNPEYFCYHSASYFEAEVEMLKYRLPQPTNKVK